MPVDSIMDSIMNSRGHQVEKADGLASDTHIKAASTSTDTTGTSSSTRPVKLHLACDICRSRKIKCDGEKPCSHCLSRGLTCVHSLQLKAGPRPREHAKVTRVVAAVRCQARGQEGPGDSVTLGSVVCLVPPAWDGVPIHIPPSCVTIVTTADAAKSLPQNAPGKAAADFLASAATTGTGSNMGTPAACVPVQEMFGSGPGRALKTEPSSQPLQELAIAHLVGDTFEPGIPGQEDFLATHPSDMIGDMPSNDCWPGTGHFSDAFDYLPMQGPGLPFQTAPVPASNAGTQHDQHQQQ